jgi:hypothetical protein
MKKVFLMLLGVIFVAGSASAMPIALNPEAIIAGTGTTGVFNELGIYIETTSTDFANGSFADVGNLAVKSLIASSPVYTSGLDSSWFLVGGWTDLQGVTPAPGQYVYTSGTLNLYLTQTPYAFNTWQLGADDDVGFTGTQVASLSLLSGTGYLLPLGGGKYTGTVDLDWKFTMIADGFWLDGNGNVLSLDDLSEGEYLMAIADANTNSVLFSLDGQGNTIVYSKHDGSVSVGVVPEPATMALFGTGLLGLAGAGLRKKRS